LLINSPRKYSKPTQSEFNPSITLEYLDGFDPWAYDLTVVIDELDNGWNIDLAYLSGRVDVGLVKQVAADFSSILMFILSRSEESIGNVISPLRR
jgi:hypothetical protein